MIVDSNKFLARISCILAMVLGTLIAVMIAGNVSASPTQHYDSDGKCAGFTDALVHVHQWCYPLEYMYARGSVVGYGTLFKPDNWVTRQQFAKMLAVTMDVNNSSQPLPSYVTGWTLYNPSTPSFADVAYGATFYSYIETLKHYGVIDGYPCGGPSEPCGTDNKPYFRPLYGITRGQMTKILSITANYTDEPTRGGDPFGDVSSYNAFYTYSKRLAMHLAISPYPNDAPLIAWCVDLTKPCLFPNHPVSRSDAVQNIAQIIQYWPSTNNLNFTRNRTFVEMKSDNPGFTGISGGISVPVPTPRASATPSTQEPVGAPLGLMDSQSGWQHFIETGLRRRFESQVGVFGSAWNGYDSGNDACTVQTLSNELTPGVIYDFKVEYVSSDSNHTWNGSVNIGGSWFEVVKCRVMGYASMPYAFTGAETFNTNESTGHMTFKGMKTRDLGGSYAGACFDTGVLPRINRMGYRSSCINASKQWALTAER